MHAALLLASSPIQFPGQDLSFVVTALLRSSSMLPAQNYLDDGGEDEDEEHLCMDAHRLH